MEVTMNRKILLGDPPPIQITGRDLGRLDVLLQGLSPTGMPVLRFLYKELDRARIVDENEVETPFVRIGSRVAFKDEDGKVYRLTLALPGEMSGGFDRISILTPVGAALVGLSEGQLIAYETPDNRIKTITVLEVSEHEPETGDQIAPAYREARSRGGSGR
jgi:regulator of nucleoside diphosphate kinase